MLNFAKQPFLFLNEDSSSQARASKQKEKKKAYQKWRSSSSPPTFYKHVHRLLKWVTDFQIINLQSSLYLHLHGALVETEPPIVCLHRQEWQYTEKTFWKIAGNWFFLFFWVIASMYSHNITSLQYPHTSEEG